MECHREQHLAIPSRRARERAALTPHITWKLAESDGRRMCVFMVLTVKRKSGRGSGAPMQLLPGSPGTVRCPPLLRESLLKGGPSGKGEDELLGN